LVLIFNFIKKPGGKSGGRISNIPPSAIPNVGGYAV
jgi:hypothetical protein